VLTGVGDTNSLKILIIIPVSETPKYRNVGMYITQQHIGMGYCD